jgi:2-polyprenyl-3-methyl-5-hydroxy-6-metoxy-1,4-benzoquinol methylase
MTDDCWVCGNESLSLIKASNIENNISSKSFSITDDNYGVTNDIYQCNSCGFMQCHKLNNVLNYYVDMKDKSYIETSEQRSLQMQKIIESFNKVKKRGKLLDVGAGSGLLVAKANSAGYVAEGIEPSVWLYESAIENNLKMYLGTLPHKKIKNKYDVVCLIDVIEHVNNPVGMLNEVNNILDNNGIGVLITPDVGSVMARILKWKWWHFRIAHIGYFNKKTIELCLNNSGFEIVSISKPSWYFLADYLFSRISNYMPLFGRIKLPSTFSKYTIPLNLYDSFQIIFQK